MPFETPLTCRSALLATATGEASADSCDSSTSEASGSSVPSSLLSKSNHLPQLHHQQQHQPHQAPPHQPHQAPPHQSHLSSSLWPPSGSATLAFHPTGSGSSCGSLFGGSATGSHYHHQSNCDLRGASGAMAYLKSSPYAMNGIAAISCIPASAILVSTLFEAVQLSVQLSVCNRPKELSICKRHASFPIW